MVCMSHTPFWIRLPLFLTYLVILITGVFVFSAQVLLYVYVSKHYPMSGRGTVLGGTAGIRRSGAICGSIFGGMLLGAGLAVPWGFYAIAAVRLLGCGFIAAVPRSPAEPVREASLLPEGAVQ
jgi:AAHS family benzoate transporter-like MFS transporter